MSCLLISIQYSCQQLFTLFSFKYMNSTISERLQLLWSEAALYLNSESRCSLPHSEVTSSIPALTRSRAGTCPAPFLTNWDSLAQADLSLQHVSWSSTNTHFSFLHFKCALSSGELGQYVMHSNEVVV